MLFSPNAVFRWLRSNAFAAPRRPRHPLLRLLFAVVGIALLLVLLVLGVFVGAAMLLGGTLWQAWARRTPSASAPLAREGVIDGSFRVIDEPRLPLSR